MNPNIIPDWAAISPQEFYEELFRFPLYETELVMEDGKTTPLKHEVPETTMEQE